MVRRGLLAAMYEATERHGAVAGDGRPALGDASISTGGAGKAAGFFARRDITRRTTGRTNCTMKATDAGMPIKVAMKATRSAGGSVSQAHDMASRVLGPGASGTILWLSSSYRVRDLRWLVLPVTLKYCAFVGRPESR